MSTSQSQSKTCDVCGETVTKPGGPEVIDNLGPGMFMNRLIVQLLDEDHGAVTCRGVDVCKTCWRRDPKPAFAEAMRRLCGEIE